jgi:hypothetical protein
MELFFDGERVVMRGRFEEGAIYGKRGKRGVAINLTTKIEEDNFSQKQEFRLP